jgi:hypothetical protein
VLAHPAYDVDPFTREIREHGGVVVDDEIRHREEIV